MTTTLTVQPSKDTDHSSLHRHRSVDSLEYFGSIDGMPIGATLMEELVHQSCSRSGGNTTERIPVPSCDHVAEIVGRQGYKIKALRSSTKTYIRTPVRGEEPAFVVTGRKEDVEKARDHILAAAKHFSDIRSGRRSSVSTPAPTGHVTVNVPVPNCVVGLVIGPKGSTIKRIQQQTHTYIVTPNRDTEPVFRVTGLQENVDRARLEIEQHIYRRTESPQGDPSRSNGVDIVPCTPSLPPPHGKFQRSSSQRPRSDFGQRPSDFGQPRSDFGQRPSDLVFPMTKARFQHNASPLSPHPNSFSFNKSYSSNSQFSNNQQFFSAQQQENDFDNNFYTAQNSSINHFYNRKNIDFPSPQHCTRLPPIPPQPISAQYQYYVTNGANQRNRALNSYSGNRPNEFRLLDDEALLRNIVLEGQPPPPSFFTSKRLQPSGDQDEGIGSSPSGEQSPLFVNPAATGAVGWPDTSSVGNYSSHYCFPTFPTCHQMTSQHQQPLSYEMENQMQMLSLNNWDRDANGWYNHQSLVSNSTNGGMTSNMPPCATLADDSAIVTMVTGQMPSRMTAFKPVSRDSK